MRHSRRTDTHKELVSLRLENQALRCKLNSILAEKEVPAEISLADKLFQGEFAEFHIEEKIDELLGFDCHHLTFDSYDNSIELYLGPESPSEWVATREFAQEIYNMGFSRFWINWANGDEQSGTGPRTPKTRHWYQGD